MMKCSFMRIWIMLACLVASGCGADPEQPPTIRYGEEACSRCRMIISDARFAAALVTLQGDVRKYDDIGCLVIEDARQPQPKARYWVRTFAGEQWLDARAASYVHDKEIQTPMGYGLLAQAADQPAKKPVLDFAALARVLEGDDASATHAEPNHTKP